MRWTQLLFLLASGLSCSLGATLQFPLHHEYNPSGSPPHPAAHLASPVTLQTRETVVYRPSSYKELLEARLRSIHLSESQPIQWIPTKVLAPDVQDMHTLSQLARMSGDAYALQGKKNWYELDPSWNTSFPFGWEDARDGFRGHVFLSSDNSTVVLAIKGTTVQGTTSKKDKFNDNLLFSCCCAHVDFSWVFRTVCDCYKKSWRCDNICLSEALIEDSLFYSVGVNLVNELLMLYPSSDVWLVGHSLGGALASLLGSTFGLPAVAFESPGERLAASRLQIPLPPPESGSSMSPVPVTHVYHNSDPIPQGLCTGFGSPCAQGGYALETRCHLGKSIVFDTITKLGWKVDVRTHVIKDVILKVLESDIAEWEDGRRVPLARAEDDCLDCFKWNFIEGDDDVQLNTIHG